MSFNDGQIRGHFISIVKPTRCTVFEFIEYSTCFGQSFRPSSGVQDCTYSIRYMSYRLFDYLLEETRWNLMLFVQSWTSVDGQTYRPKHVKWYSINSKIVHLVGFTIEIYLIFLIIYINAEAFSPYLFSITFKQTNKFKN